MLEIIPGIGKGILSFFNNYLGNALGKPGTEALGMLTDDKNYLGNYFTKATGAGLTDAEKEANAFTASREDLAWNRQLEAANTANQREVMDLKAAGLNPMLAAQGNGSSVPSASAQGSVSPSGGDLSAIISAVTGMRAQNLNKAIAMRDLDIKQSVANAQIENINADTDLKEQQANESKERERGARIVNDVKEATKEADIEAAKLRNNLSRSQANLIEKQLDEISSKIHLMAAQAATESERQLYLQASARLKDMSAWQIASLLPYQKALMSAQTDEAKASAILAATNAAYQQGLIDNGYIQSVCKEAAAKAGIAESQDLILKVTAAIRSGNFEGSPLDGGKFTNTVAGTLLHSFGVVLNELSPIKFSN